MNVYVWFWVHVCWIFLPVIILVFLNLLVLVEWSGVEASHQQQPQTADTGSAGSTQSRQPQAAPAPAAPAPAAAQAASSTGERGQFLGYISVHKQSLKICFFF